MSVQVPREFAVTVTGTSLIEWGGGQQFGTVFGFDATQVLIINDAAFDVYMTLASTAGSTGGLPLLAGERLALAGLKTYGVGLVATATSTSESFRIAAWAW